jgi:membrane protein DedA with SNARE-associated domain
MSAKPANPLWEGRGERADHLLLAGLAFSGLYALALLPAVPALVGSHPLLLEMLRGSMSSMITMGGLARIGEASLVVAVVAGIPAFMMFDWLYWWAGRRWGERALDYVLGHPEKAARRRARLHRATERFGPAAVTLAPFLPVPSALIFAAAGLGGMRLRIFLLLDLIGALLWAATMVGLGYALGQGAVDVAHAITRYSLWLTIILVVLIVARQVRQARRAQAAERVSAPAESSG